MGDESKKTVNDYIKDYVAFREIMGSYDIKANFTDEEIRERADAMFNYAKENHDARMSALENNHQYMYNILNKTNTQQMLMGSTIEPMLKKTMAYFDFDPDQNYEDNIKKGLDDSLTLNILALKAGASNIRAGNMDIGNIMVKDSIENIQKGMKDLNVFASASFIRHDNTSSKEDRFLANEYLKKKGIQFDIMDTIGKAFMDIQSMGVAWSNWSASAYNYALAMMAGHTYGPINEAMVQYMKDEDPLSFKDYVNAFGKDVINKDDTWWDSAALIAQKSIESIEKEADDINNKWRNYKADDVKNNQDYIDDMARLRNITNEKSRLVITKLEAMARKYNIDPGVIKGEDDVARIIGEINEKAGRKVVSN